MAQENFLKHKIIVAMVSDVRQSQNTIEAYKELNLLAGNESELSIQFMMEAAKLQDNGQYMEALNLLDKSILYCQGDQSLKLEALSLINHIQALTENLALESLSDVRIGQVYENFIKRGHVSLYFHAYAALHYEKIGEIEKAQTLVTKIKTIAPNLILLKKGHK